MNPNMTPQQQQQMYRQQMAQNPHMQAQMMQQQQQLIQRQQMAMAQAAYGMPGGGQHLQPQFPQQRRPSPMGQMPMGQQGQHVPMAGYGGMPPPSAGPMGGGIPPGMHPQQQAYQQQQYMQAANNPFPGGMNPQMMSASPIPPSTPNRPPSQVQLTPSPAPTGTPTNAGQPNGMTPPGQPPHPGMQGNQIPPMPQQQQSQAKPQALSKPIENSAEKTNRTGNDQMTQRIDMLLEINSIMIKCTMELAEKNKTASVKGDEHAAGQPSPTTSTPTEPANPANGESQSPSQANQSQKPQYEWFQFMRRLQGNIGYLMGSSNAGPNKKPFLWPPLMDIHPAPPTAAIGEETYKQLKELYHKLREAFPEYRPGLNPITGQPNPAQPGQMGQAGKMMGVMGPPGLQQALMQKSQQQSANEPMSGGS